MLLGPDQHIDMHAEQGRTHSIDRREGSYGYIERAVYLNGQFGAWSPRQPQWQHWGALCVTYVVHSAAAAAARIDAGTAAARCAWHAAAGAAAAEPVWQGVAGAACMAVGGCGWVEDARAVRCEQG